MNCECESQCACEGTNPSNIPESSEVLLSRIELGKPYVFNWKLRGEIHQITGIAVKKNTWVTLRTTGNVFVVPPEDVLWEAQDLLLEPT